MMKSLVVKRSIVIAGNKTSVSLEDPFWDALREIARERHVTLSALVSSIDSRREHGNLSSALRLFVLDRYRQRNSAEANGRPGLWQPSKEKGAVEEDNRAEVPNRELNAGILAQVGAAARRF